MTENEKTGKKEWDTHELTKAIGELYCSEEYQDLVSQNQEQTLMQMAGCERNETAHSAFLAKLFQTKPCSRGNSDSPLLYFLRLLAHKAKEQSSNENVQLSTLMPTDLWDNIVINNCKVEVVRVRTEAVTTAEEADGRADIVIDCRITCSSADKPYLLRIVIENKIDSNEGWKNYTDKNGNQGTIGQCEKYVKYYDEETVKMWTGIRDNIFVFLSPTSPETLSSSRFIKITYTDLLRHVLKVVLKQRSAYDENMAEALEEYIKTISSPQNNPIIAMDEEYIKLAKKFFYKNKELISMVVRAVADEAMKEELEAAQTVQPEYKVTYNGKSYNEYTKLNKLAYQAVWLLAESGASVNVIKSIFANIRPKKGLLLTSDSGQNKGEKISIQGTDYWVPTNIWAERSNYVKNLLEVFDIFPGLSYDILD